MNRRISERYHRYLPGRVWRSGETHVVLGHTSNISRTGLCVVATRVFLSGVRVRLEVGATRSFGAERVAARSLRSPPELARIEPAGMGIRFLGITELVSEPLVSAGQTP